MPIEKKWMKQKQEKLIKKEILTGGSMNKAEKIGGAVHKTSGLYSGAAYMKSPSAVPAAILRASIPNRRVKQFDAVLL